MVTFWMSAGPDAAALAPPPDMPGASTFQGRHGATTWRACFSSYRAAGRDALIQHDQAACLFVDASADAANPAATSGVQIQIDPLGRLRIFTPLTSTTALFLRAAPGDIRITTDPRFLVDASSTLNRSALYSLLQFGAIVPPLTLWHGIARLLPGFAHTVDVPAGTCTKSVLSPWPLAAPERAAEPVDPLAQLAAAFDATLTQLSPDHRPVILFSGGVDSGLIAARAAALGWKDAVLANYRFGQRDDESDHAQQMAASLGLPCTQITGPRHTESLDIDSLLSPLVEPFADHSIIPTTLLAHAVIDRFGDRATVLDGTGADGAFGLFGKTAPLKRLYRIPRLARAVAAAIYGPAALYRSTGRAERTLRLLRRSADLDALAMTVAQNPLHQIAYRFPAAERQIVHEALATWIDTCLPPSLEARVAGVDICLVCCGIFAQKARAVYDASPLALRFPFLEPRMLRLALDRAVHWPENRQPKGILKTMLARQVPRELVYRPKSGFVSPLAEQFSHPAVVDAFSQAGGPASVLTGALDTAVCQRLLADIRSQRPLPSQTYSFIWATIVADRWWRLATAPSSPQPARLIGGHP